MGSKGIRMVCVKYHSIGQLEGMGATLAKLEKYGFCESVQLCSRNRYRDLLGPREQVARLTLARRIRRDSIRGRH